MESEIDNSSDDSFESDSENSSESDSEDSLDSEENEGKNKKTSVIKYLESDCLGHFVQNGCDLEPLIGNEAKPFERHLDLEIIKKINSGTPLSCDKSYREYSSDHPEKAHVFNSIDVLEKFLDRIEFKGTRVVVSKTDCLYKLITPLLYRFSTNPEIINFSLNEKFWLLLEESDQDLHIEDWEKHKTEPISIELMLKDNAFTKEKPVLHESRMFRVMKHSFEHVNLISATEVDALWEEKNNECVAIKRLKRRKYLEETDIVFEKKFLGGIDKLIVPVVENKMIDEVSFVDNIDKLELAKYKKQCKKLIANFFDWFHRFVRETRSLNGELRVSGAGIVAHSKKHYAIYDKLHPDRLHVYGHDVKPRLFLSEKKFNSPRVNRETCFSFQHLNKFRSNPKRSPTINYAKWSDELDDVQGSDLLFAQERSKMSKKGIKHCQTAQYPIMIHFLRCINPDIIKARIPILPVVAASPSSWHVPMERINYHLAIDEPWTCHTEQGNVIVAFGSLINLHRIVDFHEWPRDKVLEVKLTIVLIKVGNVPENAVRSILRRSFSDNTVNNARIEVFSVEQKGREFLVEFVGVPKSLYLVDKDSSVLGNMIYDFQMIDDFIENGFSNFRDRPTLIFVYGSEEQYQTIVNIIRENCLQIRVRRGSKL